MQLNTFDQQKITATLPKPLLEAAQQVTGKGITETLRQGLEHITRKQSYATLLAFQGKYQASTTLDELRQDR